MSNTITITRNDFAGKGAEESLKAAIVVSMVRLHKEAVALAPVDLGQLKNSIMWRRGWNDDVFNFPKDGGFNEAGGNKKADKKIDQPDGIEGYVGTAVEYATYQEFGTRYQKAQPYMRPAADIVRKGSTGAEIKRKWGPEAMQAEFDKRKKTTKVVKSG